MSSIEETIASLNPGDYVRVSVGARSRRPGFDIAGSCWVDEYQSLWVGSVVLRRDANGGFSNAVTDVEIVSRALPPEPPLGSVVLDDYGDAWQHTFYFSKLGWRRVADDVNYTWKALNHEYGPLCVIHTPEADS